MLERISLGGRFEPLVISAEGCYPEVERVSGPPSSINIVIVLSLPQQANHRKYKVVLVIFNILTVQ